MTTFIDEVNISIDKAGLTGKHKVIYKVALRKDIKMTFISLNETSCRTLTTKSICTVLN